MAFLFGDINGTLDGKTKGAAQALVGTSDENNQLYGDATGQSSTPRVAATTC